LMRGLRKSQALGETSSASFSNFCELDPLGSAFKMLAAAAEIVASASK